MTDILLIAIVVALAVHYLDVLAHLDGIVRLLAAILHELRMKP